MRKTSNAVIPNSLASSRVGEGSAFLLWCRVQPAVFQSAGHDETPTGSKPVLLGRLPLPAREALPAQPCEQPLEESLAQRHFHKIEKQRED